MSGFSSFGHNCLKALRITSLSSSFGSGVIFMYSGSSVIGFIEESHHVFVAVSLLFLISEQRNQQLLFFLSLLGQLHHQYNHALLQYMD